MTSKKLFANLLKENSKRRLWPTALSIAGNFFAQIVFAILMMGRYKERLLDGRTVIEDVRADFYRNVAGVHSFPITFIIVVLAFLIALQGYYYLFDSRQTDLYYSLPVRRQRIFDAFNLVGILTFAIPFVICHIIVVIMGFARGYVELGTIPMLIGSAAIIILEYVFFYEVCVLAAVLTGHVVVAALGCAVFFLLGPIVATLKEIMMQIFFVSYMGSYRRVLYTMTPFRAVTDMTEAITGKNIKAVEFHLGAALVPFLIVLAITLGCYVLSRFLVDRRPAEAAGKSMAFEITKPVIKIVMMVVASIGGGLVMYYTSEFGNIIIFIFGMVCGALIVHFVIETIFEFDFKASFGHFGSFFAGALISAAILLICVFDIFGYESWQPMPGRVASVSIADDFAYRNMRCPYYRAQDNADLNDTNYPIDNTEFALANMSLTDIEAVEKLTRKGAINAVKEHKKARLWGARYYSGQVSYNDEDTLGCPVDMSVKWTLKSGREITRNYTVDLNDQELLDAFGMVYESEEYKLGKVPALSMSPSEVGEISCETVAGDYEKKVNEDIVEGLISAYREDIMNQTFEDITNEVPVLELNLVSEEFNYRYGDYNRYNIYIYPSFKKTNEYLAKNMMPTSWRDGEEIIKKATLGVQFWDEDDEYSHDEYLTISDKKEIANVLDNSFPDYAAYSCGNMKYEVGEDGISLSYDDLCYKEVTFTPDVEGDYEGFALLIMIREDDSLSQNIKDFCFPDSSDENETSAVRSGTVGWMKCVSNG